VEINKQGRHVQQKLASVLDIPGDIVMDLPKMTIIGNIQLYIENHRGIIEYSSDTIRISVSFGEIEITGENLTIRTITRDEIHLDGVITVVRCNR